MKEKIQNHEGFQFGTNPMKMSAYEQAMVLKEREERETARKDYVKGIQGRDGGHFPNEKPHSK